MWHCSGCSYDECAGCHARLSDGLARSSASQSPMARQRYNGPFDPRFHLTLWKPTASTSLGLGLGEIITNWNADVGAMHPSVAILRPGIAQDAGLMVGDVILQVNSQPACGHLATTSRLQQAEGAVDLVVHRRAGGRGSGFGVDI